MKYLPTIRVHVQTGLYRYSRVVTVDEDRVETDALDYAIQFVRRWSEVKDFHHCITNWIRQRIGRWLSLRYRNAQLPLPLPPSDLLHQPPATRSVEELVEEIGEVRDATGQKYLTLEDRRLLVEVMYKGDDDFLKDRLGAVGRQRWKRHVKPALRRWAIQEGLCG